MLKKIFYIVVGVITVVVILDTALLIEMHLKSHTVTYFILPKKLT
jgi:hypothetical protein